MKARVSKDECIGCCACQSILPEVFELEDDGLACVKGEITDENKDDVIDASESCPTGAIKIEK